MPIDYSRYPKNWKELRDQVLLRANNKCEVCGVNNGQLVYVKMVGKKTKWYKTFEDFLSEYADNTSIKKYLINNEHKIKRAKVVLTIAHLDHDETNHNVTIDRLMAMCQVEHLQYDVEEKKRRRKQKI